MCVRTRLVLPCSGESLLVPFLFLPGREVARIKDCQLLPEGGHDHVLVDRQVHDLVVELDVVDLVAKGNDL